MFRYFILLFIFLLSNACLAKDLFDLKSFKTLFFIERNKNNNKVLYQVKADYKKCVIKNKKEPLRAIWHDLEDGPEVYSHLSRIDKIAYGISKQIRLNENEYKIELKALDDRDVILRKVKSSKCEFVIVLESKGHKVKLNKVYVQAKETFYLPRVQYIQLFSKRLDNNQEVIEKIEP